MFWLTFNSLSTRSSSTVRLPSLPTCGLNEWNNRISLFISSLSDSLNAPQSSSHTDGRTKGSLRKLSVSKYSCSFGLLWYQCRSRRNSSRENFYGAGMKVRPFSNKLICAADRVKSLDKFKILEEEDQVKSGGGVEFLPKHHRLVCFNFPVL